MQYTVNCLFETKGQTYVVTSIWVKQSQIYKYDIQNVRTLATYTVDADKLNKLPKQAFKGLKKQ